MVLGSQCAILLGPAMARKWVDQGGNMEYNPTGRSVTVPLWFGSEARCRTKYFTAV